MSSSDLDLKRLMGEDEVIKTTDYAINSLLVSLENFSNTTTVKGTGNIFDCAISLGDLDFDLNLDFFNIEPSKMDFILLNKISYLRRLITDINNIFINLIQDLECCTGDDRYNRTIIPIFKWLVEDENGLCGTLLRISKEINKIYIPLKRILCIFRNVPGNPTIGFAGMDFLKFVYPIVDGLEKVMNLLDNGRFLDILIIPVKDFHDKLLACSNGKDVDFYTGYSSLKDIISNSIYDELTLNLIDEIKRTQNPDFKVASKLPIPPTPPLIDYKTPAPNIKAFENYSAFSKALYQWNASYSDFRKEKERDYNEKYAEYLYAMQKYRKDKFEATLSLSNEKFENSTFAVELMTDDFKNKHRSICGCLGEIFRLDGYFIPTEYIIRNEEDLNGLIGEVEYLGVKSRDYYIDSEQKRIKIINSANLKNILSKPTETSFEETLKYPFIKDNYLSQISLASTIGQVIDLNKEYTKLINEKTYEFRRMSNFYDSVNSAFYTTYLNEIEGFRKKIALYKNGQANEIEMENSQKSLYQYSSYPPASWVSGEKQLSKEYQKIFGSLTYRDYLKEVDKLKEKNIEINDIREAYGRNHAILKIVDNTKIECGCDLLCMVIKYIINLILSIIKKLISYITKYLMNAVMNKELQWWIKFVTEKIKCIIDILNISKDINKMEDAFNQEIQAAKNSIKKAPESVANCSTSTKSIIDELNLYDKKSKVNPETIKDLNWKPDLYPELLPEDGNYNVTPNFEDSFNIITNNVLFQRSGWKNRTIPTMVLDCTKNFRASVDWKPKTGIWKMYMNVEININQFNSTNGIPIDNTAFVSDEDLLSNMYNSLLYKLFTSAVFQTNFNFKIEIGNDIYEYNTDNLRHDVLEDVALFNNDSFLYKDIKRVWFKDTSFYNQYFKVYDRMQEADLKAFRDNITSQLIENLDKVKNLDFPEVDDIQTSSKYCSPVSLRVSKFEPLYNDPAGILFPGKVERNDADPENITFSYYPIVREDGVTINPITQNNVPFMMVLTNAAGQDFTLICLIDVCEPSMVMSTPYRREIDGVFLNGRYDYFEFDSIPNNQSYTISEKNIIKRLRGYLENIGAISSLITGPLSALDIQNKVDGVVDNTKEEILQSVAIDYKEKEELAYQVVNNLPDGIFKDAMKLIANMSENITQSLDELKILENLSNDFNLGYENITYTPEIIAKKEQILGIPLVVLNEKEKIILTIHNKKLKLINLNSNFNLDTSLETIEIDYKEGEQLFIEYSTNGFEHTIAWLNERKISAKASTLSTNNIDLFPTQIGSYYDNGILTSLMCGKINDLIFTESDYSTENWYTNSNTFRPSGTIGFYDFSVFDGYHVYSIPEFFKVTKLNSVLNIKGILYESKEFSREEIMARIQDNKYNEILANEVTIVGERPVSVGGNFIWQNKKYYKNVSFGYLENFFCRDNLAGESFTISFWLKLKDAETNGREKYKKQYIFSDTNTGNFIWLEDDMIHLQMFGQYLIKEPVNLIFIKDLIAEKPEYVEKWFHHVFKYNKKTGEVTYTLKSIDKRRNFDSNYPSYVLDDIIIKVPLLLPTKYGKKLNFSLVTMLARFDVEKLNYSDFCWAEITALAIWKEFKDDNFMLDTYNYQRKIIINDMEG